ncbi:MAG TPA: S9 family peptidase [Pyrinomonadaceae bacterium]|nr:S9 family peptidase [Pyrinomonadaceae bacterium]
MTRRAAVHMCVLAIALVFGATSLWAQSKKLTIEDALSLQEVGAPQWSPDGKLVAFTVSEWNRKENRRDTHIHIVPAGGGASFKLTNGERGETMPQWSPDSRRIAFLANRDAPRPDAPAAPRNQIWVIPVAGGEAERVTDEEVGVAQFRWSPDGRRLAYVVRDTPQDKAERDKRKKEKFDAIVVDSGFIYSHLWTINLDTKEKRRVTEGSFTVADPQWSPDGQWLAYTMSKSGSQESAFTDISDDRNTDLYVAPANAAATTTGMAATMGASSPRQLTTNPGPDYSPRFSPDSKWIAYLSSNDPNSWAGKSDLYVMPTPSGGATTTAAPRNLTGAYNDSINGAPKWSPDGTTLYAAGAEGVYGQLLKIAVAGNSSPQAIFTSKGAYTGVDLSRDGRMLAFAFNDAKTPNDIWAAQSTGKGAVRLTNFNQHVKDYALVPTEVVRWKAPDNLEIEGLLVKPLGYEAGKRYPLILQIHGGPYAQFAYGFNTRAQIFAANGYAVLLPNPRGSTGYGQKFTTANIGDWGGKDYQDLMAGVDELIKTGLADPERLGVMGGSYGGFMTFWVITQTDRFKAAIGHAGISDWYSFHGQSDIPGLMEYGFGGTPWTAREAYEKWSPVRFADRVKTPLMITHGEQDRRVPIAQAEQYYRALRKRGVETVFVRYPREGHGIIEPNHQIDLVGRQLEWFNKHLKSSPKPVAVGLPAHTHSSGR